MSMTREEAIATLEESKRQNKIMIDNPTTFWASHQMAEGVKNAKRRIEAFEIALTALRPVSREQVERMRGEWIVKHDKYNEITIAECSKCGDETMYEFFFEENDSNFCPHCGTPMTDEAVQMVMARLEELNEA